MAWIKKVTVKCDVCGKEADWYEKSKADAKAHAEKDGWKKVEGKRRCAECVNDLETKAQMKKDADKRKAKKEEPPKKTKDKPKKKGSPPAPAKKEEPTKSIPGAPAHEGKKPSGAVEILRAERAAKQKSMKVVFVCKKCGKKFVQDLHDDSPDVPCPKCKSTDTEPTQVS